MSAVFFDVDDTLSTDGHLTAGAYASLWELKEAGFVLVPVTGRPAGWCDHMARFWPVDAVVGENGAFVMRREGAKLRTHLQPALAAFGDTDRIERLKTELRLEFPQAEWASDQPYRRFDLAVDFCEDVPRWSEIDIARLLSFFSARGVHAKRSSIHVNAWYGDYDKRAGVDLCFEVLQAHGIFLDNSQVIFAGDSPNDEPLFAYLPASVGVANLAPFLASLRSPPRWMTQSRSGEGFQQLARALIAAQKV